jgi:hypothetical protein
MFSTCVARGIAAKLVLKSVGGQVVTSLYCSSSSTTTSAARANQKQGRKRPDNERRRMRREAWIQRRHSSKPGPAARTAAVASAVPVSEGEAAAATAAAVPASEGEAAAAAAVLAPQGAAAAATSLQGLAQSLVQVDMPAALGTASVVPTPAAKTPPRTWMWEPRNRLVAVARKIKETHLESPETVRRPEAIGELNISLSSMTEERTEEEEAKGGEGAEPEPVFRPPPTPPPWSRHFSSHPMRVLCTFCFAGNRETRNSRCSDCFRAQRENLKK